MYVSYHTGRKRKWKAHVSNPSHTADFVSLIPKISHLPLRLLVILGKSQAYIS